MSLWCLHGKHAPSIYAGLHGDKFDRRIYQHRHHLLVHSVNFVVLFLNSFVLNLRSTSIVCVQATAFQGPSQMSGRCQAPSGCWPTCTWTTTPSRERLFFSFSWLCVSFLSGTCVQRPCLFSTRQSSLCFLSANLMG